jgi:hypothetical protein
MSSPRRPFRLLTNPVFLAGFFVVWVFEWDEGRSGKTFAHLRRQGRGFGERQRDLFQVLRCGGEQALA